MAQKRFHFWGSWFLWKNLYNLGIKKERNKGQKWRFRMQCFSIIEIWTEPNRGHNKTTIAMCFAWKMNGKIKLCANRSKCATFFGSKHVENLYPRKLDLMLHNCNFGNFHTIFVKYKITQLSHMYLNYLIERWRGSPIVPLLHLSYPNQVDERLSKNPVWFLIQDISTIQ